MPHVLQGSTNVAWTDKTVNDNSIVSVPATQKYALAIKKLIEIFCGVDASGDYLHDALWNIQIFCKHKNENMFQYLNHMNPIFYLDTHLLQKMYIMYRTNGRKTFVILAWISLISL